MHFTKMTCTGQANLQRYPGNLALYPTRIVLCLRLQGEALSSAVITWQWIGEMSCRYPNSCGINQPPPQAFSFFFLFFVGVVLRGRNPCQSHHDDQLLLPRTLMSGGLWLGAFLVRLPLKSGKACQKTWCSIPLSTVHPFCGVAHSLVEVTQWDKSTLDSFSSFCICFSRGFSNGSRPIQSRPLHFYSTFKQA